MKSRFLLAALVAAAPAVLPNVARAQMADAPIIIGEPVRRQTASVTPAPSKAKTAITAAGVDISGLTENQAVAKMRAALEPQLKEPIRLVIGSYQYTYTRAELGASVAYWPMMRAARRDGSSALRLDLNRDKALKMLRELDAQVKTDFENTALNVGGSAARVRLALTKTEPQPLAELLTIPFKSAPDPIIETAPATQSADGKFPYLLADYATTYDAGLRGRTINLKMAAKNINGTVVAPNAVFSTNAAIGPRNASAGWREAKMFVSGQVVSGTGSGICQAASTLYNAALLADVPIIERHAHSMRVMYVPPSQDAALMWGQKDFKFRNTSGAPMRVETYVSGGKFHARLWSQKPRSGGAVKVTSRVLSRAGGTKSEAYKTVGGKEVCLSRDYYAPHP